MKLIDKRITEILLGYQTILQAEIDLRSYWRPSLLAAYAQRRRVYDEAAARRQRRKIIPVIFGALGMILLLAGFFILVAGLTNEDSKLLLTFCGGPLISLLGFLILIAAVFSHLYPGNSPDERVPVHPLHGGAQGQSLFPNLRTAWMQGLSGGIINEIPDYPDHLINNEKDYGAEGERLFISRMGEICGPNDFILARTMQRAHEDVDLILIGNRGIWVFEVKHWSGEIFWDDQGWRRTQTYFERGGIETTKEAEVGEPPDQQWIRAAAEVSRTLHYRTPEILEKYPELETVRGGIVFTHPDAHLNFKPGRPTYWGSLRFWQKTIEEIEPDVQLDTTSALSILEALLDRHHEMAPSDHYRSMAAYAEGVVQEADEQLAAWVQAP